MSKATAIFVARSTALIIITGLTNVLWLSSAARLAKRADLSGEDEATGGSGNQHLGSRYQAAEASQEVSASIARGECDRSIGGVGRFAQCCRGISGRLDLKRGDIVTIAALGD
jgi:hypothetical protein